MLRTTHGDSVWCSALLSLFVCFSCRDIKLENLFISSSGHLQLGDFGLAISTQVSPSSLQHSRYFWHHSPCCKQGHILCLQDSCCCRPLAWGRVPSIWRWLGLQEISSALTACIIFC